MPVPEGTINRDAVIFDLREATIHIEDLCKEIERGEHDDTDRMVFAIEFEHIMSHLCRAWHRTWMSDEDIDGTSEDDFDRMCTSIPKWHSDYRLVELDEPMQFDCHK